MVTIISPPYSFVQYRTEWPDIPSYEEDAVEGNDLGFALPCNTAESMLNELPHQFILEASSSAEADLLMTYSPAYFTFFVVSGSGRRVSPATDPGGTIYDYIFRTHFYFPWMSRFRIAANRVLIWISNFPHIPRFAFPYDTWADHDGECFQLVFEIKTSLMATPVIRAISNQFKFQKELEYTTFIRYKGNENEAEFNYCADPVLINGVRVPFYLRSPQYPEEVSMYRTSQGDLKSTKEIVTKQYEVLTDQMPEWIHDCLRAALVHDNIYIRGKKYIGNGRKNGPYNIDWEDRDYPAGTAKFKFDVSPLVIKNNNCGSCASLTSFARLAPGIMVSGGSGDVVSVVLTDFLETDAEDLVFGFEIIDTLSPPRVEDVSITTDEGTGAVTLSFTVVSAAQLAADIEAIAVWASNDTVASNVAIISLTITQ